MTRCLAILIVALAGCCQTPTYINPGQTSDPWNTAYLIDAEPDSVSMAAVHSHALTLGEHYWDYAQVDGVLWPPWRTDPSLEHPDRWTNGGDSGIFTGMALAAFSFEYGTTRTDEALARVTDTARGLYILTHGTGKPGVIMRCAFPTSDEVKFDFPDGWSKRILSGYVGSGPAMADPFGGPEISSRTYYTRATKDQLTGMVLGLAAAWKVMSSGVSTEHQEQATKIRSVLKTIANDLYEQLAEHRWNIRNEHGTNDTSADHVDGLLRACVLGLVVHMGNTDLQADYDEEFNSFISLSKLLRLSDRFNTYSQYYAYNLRMSRALTIFILEGSVLPKGKAAATYVAKNVWHFTRGHKNAWFAFIRATMSPEDSEAVGEGLRALKSLSLKPIRMWASPYHGQDNDPGLLSVGVRCESLYVLDPHLRKPTRYFTWQKDPWSVGSGKVWDKNGFGDTSGLGYLLSYWTARYAGIF